MEAPRSPRAPLQRGRERDDPTTPRAWKRLALYSLLKRGGPQARRPLSRGLHERARSPSRCAAASTTPPLSVAAHSADAASYTSDSAAERERAAGILHALRLAQEGREPELEHALRELGCSFRLAPAVLCYAAEFNAMVAAAGERDHVPADGCAFALEAALNAPFLAHMQQALGAEARFWRETGYLNGHAGYFSYVHPLGREPDSVMDQLIAQVRKLMLPRFPQLAEASYGEWWAHNREHTKGHQLHFDSDDEGIGGVRNPIASTVLFLSAAGGPTLVTKQELSSTALASHGWLVYPRENRLVGFDGRLLHSVIPGRAAFSTHRRRVTVMIAFWKNIRTRDPPGGGHALGAARSFPDPQARGTPGWSSDFQPFDGEIGPPLASSLREAPVVPVRPVWLPVPPRSSGERGGEAQKTLKSQRAGRSRPLPLPPYDELFQG